MLPRARIARVPWWRRLLAWFRASPVASFIWPTVANTRALPEPSRNEAYTDRERAIHERLLRDGLHLHVFGKRCPDCTPELAVMRTPREEIEFEIFGMSIDKVEPLSRGDYVRPAPTTMPGELERRS